MAGDRSVQLSYSKRNAICRSIEMLRETACAECGAHSQTGHFFRLVLAERFFRDRNSRILFFRNWRARQDSNVRPPA